MSTTQQHSNIPSTAVEFAPITDVDLALAAELAQQCGSTPSGSTSAGSGHPTSVVRRRRDGGPARPPFPLRLGRPEDPANDHLIFSKGHASPLLYSVFRAAGVVPTTSS